MILRPLELPLFCTSAKSAKVSSQELQQNIDHVQVRVEVLLERISLEDGLIDLMKSFGAVLIFLAMQPLVVLKAFFQRSAYPACHEEPSALLAVPLLFLGRDRHPLSAASNRSHPPASQQSLWTRPGC